MAGVETVSVPHRAWYVAKPKAIFILVHGLGAHTGRWESLADFFVARGISSYAIALRDPEIPPERAWRTEYFANYYRAILRLRNAIQHEYPTTPLFIVGESMGALIAFLLCIDHPQVFAGLIVLSPAFKARKQFTLHECIAIAAPVLYDPSRQHPAPFNSAMCTQDSAYRAQLESDPHEYRTISSRMAFEIFLAQARAAVLKKKLRTPTLFLLAGNDLIVDDKAAQRVFNGLTVEDKTLIMFAGMYHALSIERDRAQVFAKIDIWVTERI